MSQNFQLLEYMNTGIRSIISDALKASLKNPRESAFLLKYLPETRQAEKTRLEFENSGKHIPPFLIASITSNCNLFCKGCYSRANHSCETEEDRLLSLGQWNEIFRQARELGVSFILLAGGEPFLRREIIQLAGQWERIVFPVFTNGTMFDEDYFLLFDRKRNLIPVLSMEGPQAETNRRRGEGVYQVLTDVMKCLGRKGIFYGVSITVTSENIKTVTDKDFLSQLFQNGCKIVFYVEYVPVTPGSKHLAPSSKEREFLEERLIDLRSQRNEMIFLSFPGDEKYSGGCMAAGRGFLHINADGSAEPCPFSPYSDLNLKECSLSEALDSKLFKNLNSSGMLLEDHDGGCALFGREEEIKKMLEL
jgi:Predicted Fe-S oxidoreductases